MKLSYPLESVIIPLIIFSRLPLILKGSDFFGYNWTEYHHKNNYTRFSYGILGRLFLHTNKSVASTYHMALKFPTYMGI